MILPPLPRQGMAQAFGLGRVFLRHGLSVAFRDERNHGPQHVVQEKAEPDAGAHAVHAHGAQAVVPVVRAHEGEAVFAQAGQGGVQGAQAMSVKGRIVPGRARDKSDALLAMGDGPAFQVGDAFVQDGAVAAAVHVAAGQVGQPHVRIRGPVAHAQTGLAVPGLVPPLQDVAVVELLSGMEQDLGPGLVRPQIDEGQHVLELVAEAIGPAALLRSQAAPESGVEDLVG